jgi:hypothetical protein
MTEKTGWVAPGYCAYPVGAGPGVTPSGNPYQPNSRTRIANFGIL